MFRVLVPTGSLDCRPQRSLGPSSMDLTVVAQGSRHRTTGQSLTCTASPASHVEEDFWAEVVKSDNFDLEEEENPGEPPKFEDE
ncbi:hypothetical protein LAZ67_16002782 [Cordylochernes scorpioides]|uniref:Uncharacterized protein n=1 Tax=Cordylochernes scorpioides TaxID=51811 RepID=A0ABY6LCK9_9ARAC|nr:hypothetical protein LAZ67_16002782 [Cordylochernes scorpioides]